MKEHIERFLTAWWLGLRAPWASNEPSYSLVTWNESSQSLILPTTNNDKQTDTHYHQVASHQVLSCTLSPEQMTKSLTTVISDALPFDADEVYATIHKNTLFAVLKTDIAPIQSALSEHNQELSGLVFDHDHQPITLAISNSDSNAVSVVKTICAISLIVFGLAVLFLNYNDSQRQTIERLQNELQLTQSSHVSHQISLTETSTLPSLTDVRIEDVITALLKLNTTISDDTHINHLQLHSHETGLTMILDAESKNAAALLAQFEDSPTFEKSQFVSAISSDANNTIERFRLKTNYQITAPLNTESEASDE